MSKLIKSYVKYIPTDKSKTGREFWRLIIVYTDHEVDTYISKEVFEAFQALTTDLRYMLDIDYRDWTDENQKRWKEINKKLNDLS